MVSPFSFKACAEVNELFDLFQCGSIVHYIDAGCVSANDHDLRVVLSFNDMPKRSDALPIPFGNEYQNKYILTCMKYGKKKVCLKAETKKIRTTSRPLLAYRHMT